MKKFFTLNWLFVFLINVFFFSQSICQNPIPQPFPCLVFNSQNTANLNGMYSANKCIIVGDNNAITTNINVQDANNVTFKAGNQISMETSSAVKTTGNGKFRAHIEKSIPEAVWYLPSETPGFVSKFHTMEIGFDLPSSISSQISTFLSTSTYGLNPFDPEQIDFKIHLTNPNGTEFTRYAFYYRPFIEDLATDQFHEDTTSFPWRFRFAPDVLGLWKIDVEVIVAGSSNVLQSNLTFVCLPSSHKGVLQWTYTNTDSDRWLKYSETNETFFAVSNNVSSGGFLTYKPSQNRRQMVGVQQLINAGGNFSRFDLNPQGALPDWDLNTPDLSHEVKNYRGKFDEMYAFDRLMKLCEDNDMYYTIFRHHVEVRDGVNDTGNISSDSTSWDGVSWQQNPYKSEFGLSNTYQYFTDEEVIKWQKNTLRYIFSRWGYSPNLAFYGYSEVEKWYSKLFDDDKQPDNFLDDGGTLDEKESIEVLRDWIKDQKDYIQTDLSNSIMFCNSYGTLSTKENNNNFQGVFYVSDVIGIHNYEQVKEVNFKIRYNGVKDVWKEYHKPVIIEEMGVSDNKLQIYCCTGIEYHNSIWSTAMMGDFGTGMDWWWDRGVQDFGYEADLKNIQSFFKDEDLRTGKYEPQKWDKGTNSKNRKLENFALKSEDKERVLGWIHNATYYWWNIREQSTCMENLITNSQCGQNCLVEHNPYYLVSGGNEYTNMNVLQANAGYGDSERFEDNLGLTTYTGNNRKFEISGLKINVGIKKQWYRVEYYSTKGSNMDALSEYQDVHTNVLGKIHPLAPNLNSENPDYAYKVTYLGKYKNLMITADSTQDTTITEVIPTPISSIPSRSDDFMIIYPNPSKGNFQIVCTELIKEIKMYDLLGNVLLNKSEVNQRQYDATLILEKGTYVIQVLTDKGNYINRKVIIQ